MLEVAARAAKYLESDATKSISSFVLSKRNPDGGFRGRGGQDSDLYYTVFGAATLRATGSLKALLRLARYIKSFGSGEGLDFTHLACLARLRAGLMRFSIFGKGQVLQRLEEYRSQDGGYNHSEKEAAHGTSYAAFLALLAYIDMKRPLPDANRLLESLKKLRSDDGGYSNHTESANGSTNATAAAVMVHRLVGKELEDGVSEWLLARHHLKGGFLANPSAPVPDLLSTASALFALDAMNVDLAPVREACIEFVESLWHDSGGFCGNLLDDVPDCEYTFYALLALGCLS